MLQKIKKYEDVQDRINRIFRSGLQVKTLLALGDGNKSLSDLRAITGSSSQALLPVIRKLEADHLILSLKTDYCLTPSGKIIYSKIVDCIHTFDILKNQHTFFRDHYLDGIPFTFLENLSDLRNCRIISDTNVEIFQVYTQFLTCVKNANQIFKIFCIMSSRHADAIIARASEGIPVQLIVSNDVAEQLMNQPYKEKFHQSLKEYPNFSIRSVSDPIKLGLLITDKTLTIGLYKSDGITFDSYTALTSNDETAMNWGHEVYRYYKERSQLVVFD